MCKWCGTRYCKECLRGDFTGEMKEPTICRKCNQPKCQGQKVEFVIRPKSEEDGKDKKRGASSRSRSPTKSAKSTKSSKSGKKSGKKSAGKKKKKK